ncbi:MAG: hypothetical protein U0229_02295 [Anaeromyxobacter sp.]
MPLPRDPFGQDEDAAGEEAGPGDEGASEESRRLIPETVKRALLAGVGALFMTEEGARKLARDWKLPKEVVGFVGSQASAAKDEVLRLLGQEVRRFLESETVRREFLKALSESTIELHAEIRVRPDAAGRPRPEVKATARRKPTRKARK